MSLWLAWKLTGRVKSERKRESRDIHSERERELASCAMPCVKAFMHDCLLVSAERLLVPFVVSTVVSQLPRAMCLCVPQQIRCWVCWYGLAYDYSGKRVPQISSIHRNICIYFWLWHYCHYNHYIQLYFNPKTLTSGNFHPFDCGGNGVANCALSVLGLNGNKNNNLFMKDKDILCWCGLAKTPRCIPTSQLGQTPAVYVTLFRNNRMDGWVDR